MASSNPSTLRPSNLSPSDRVLRTITIVSFVPAFSLALPHVLSSHMLFPVLGLVPMFLSSIFGMLCLIINLKWLRWLPLCVDGLIAVYLLGMMLPFWIVAGNVWNAHIMLGSYATVPLMLNFCIHFFFVVREIFSGFRITRSCPHCHTDMRGSIVFPRIERVSSDKQTRLRHSCGGGNDDDDVYEPVATEAPRYDDDARESSEVDMLFRPSTETLFRPSMDTLESAPTILNVRDSKSG